MAGYLIGAVPFGWLVARWRGVDILRQGSGNIGATNVGRVLGRRFGALVFALDFAKGALPVLAAQFLAPLAGQDLPPDSLPVAAGVAAFLGHLFPIYLRFRGGKGVATGVGVVTVLTPWLALAVLAAWVVVLAASRYVSVASLTAAALLSALRLTLTPDPWSWDHVVVTAFCLFGTVLVVLRHAGNIRRLLHGSENRLQDSPAMLLFSKTVHVLALGLWFGTVVFFFVVGLVLFQTFDEIGRQRQETIGRRGSRCRTNTIRSRRATSSPTPCARNRVRAPPAPPSGPIFPWYYGIQAGCGVVTLITALGWWLPAAGRAFMRSGPCCWPLALVGVGFGWWMAGVVERPARSRGTT